jgi:RNA recognition motif-containing protein
MNLFLGNLSWDATEEELLRHFSGFGPIKQVKIMTDRDTGKPRGFGFVEFENRAHGDEAMKATNGVEFMGRTLAVEEAKPRENRPRQGGDRDRGRPYR